MDSFIIFFHQYIKILDPFDFLFQTGQFMIMCSKKRTGTNFVQVTNIFTDCPGNTQTIIGTCPSPNLIKDYKTFSAGIIYNISHLIHFYHKSTLTGCQIITGSNPGKNTVYKTYPGRVSWNKTPYLCH